MKSLEDLEPYSTMYVDAMNLLVRNHYGMSLLEYRGHKTGMLMGVARSVIDWRRRNPGLRFVFVWEGRDSWRKERYPIYKAQRKGARDSTAREEFFYSLDVVKGALPVMGVDQVVAHTYEADDTVWTSMRMDSGRKMFCSTDWDWWPLVDYGDILYQSDVLTEASLQAKFTKKFKCDPIPMARMWVFKVLTGDPSDNVSGIPRFPKKLAAKLACDVELGEGDLIHGMIKHGEKSWAEKTAMNKWILDRNLELIKAAPPPPDDLEWVDGQYSEEGFGDVLLKSGMGHLYDRLTGGDRGD